ncbi:outer membrane beta-barrel protein [Bradyrhizobium sp.]|uniref:outer membrane protein n=1 Tax=Bradyrhizobium sp. TaxID=376 RepID=UPI001D3C7DE2|nr:outer membrane beta-barrel protein [Bradyrhizobium sp.]MBI5321783.1 porin family protein [Bradyrhizobium sp.]
MTLSVSHMMRQLVRAAAAIALLTTTSARSADLPVKAAPLPVAAPLWTAFYIGAHGGWGQGRSRLEDPGLVAFGPNPVFVESRGSLAGVQVGADWQFGNLVVGGEIDASWSSIKGSLTDPAAFVAFFSSGLSAEYKALATATGRVGYAYGNLLGYAKSGVAWANIDYRSGINTPFPTIVDHQRTGLTAGAGLEFLVMSNLSVRAEYDFMYFGATATSAGCFRMPCNIDHELHLVKLGLNWRFTGDYLTARY